MIVVRVSIEPLERSNAKQSQTGAIDDVHRATVRRKDKEEHEEGKRIVEGLAKLKYELQHNRHLTLVQPYR